MNRHTTVAAVAMRTALVASLLSFVLLWGCELGMDSGVEECNVSPTSLSFGAVSLGAHSDKSFVIENLGTGSLTGSVTEDSVEFSIHSGGGDFSLAEGASMMVVVRFEPVTGGSHDCTVDLGTRCNGVHCTGTGGTGPICEVNPESMDFGDVEVGSVFGRSFTIRNVGDGIMVGYVSVPQSDFSITEGDGTYSLERGQVLNVGVRFEPTSAGPQSVTVATGTDCGDVECTGNGVVAEP